MECSFQPKLIEPETTVQRPIQLCWRRPRYIDATYLYSPLRSTSTRLFKTSSDNKELDRIPFSHDPWTTLCCHKSRQEFEQSTERYAVIVLHQTDMISSLFIVKLTEGIMACVRHAAAAPFQMDLFHSAGGCHKFVRLMNMYNILRMRACTCKDLLLASSQVNARQN